MSTPIHAAKKKPITIPMHVLSLTGRWVKTGGLSRVLDGGTKAPVWDIVELYGRLNGLILYPKSRVESYMYMYWKAVGGERSRM